MKPASIISLIVAVMLVIAGFVTCLVAKGMAESEGESLFAEKVGEDYVHTVRLEDTPLDSLDFTVSDAVVYVHGKSSESYMEIINFKDNYYNLSTGNQTLSFSEVPDVLSMFKFWENGFSFKGMRYILNPNGPDDGAKRTIHVYLNSENIKIADLRISAENCEIHLDSLSHGTDFTLSLTDSTLSMDMVSLSNSLTVMGETVQLQMDRCVLNQLVVHTADLQMECTESEITARSEIHFTSGAVNIRFPAALHSFNILLETNNNGVITVNNNPVGTSYKRSLPGITWEIVSSDGGVIHVSDPGVTVNS